MLASNLYDPAFVRALFDEMAATYGVMNLITSFGFARRWRRQLVRGVSIPTGAAVVDLMTGQGELCPDVARQVGPEGRIAAVDISPVMCAQAARYTAGKLPCEIRVIEADALRCDLPDASADVVVSSFGLKTFSAEQLAELAAVVFRLLRPGGAFAFIEISVPPAALLRAPYLFYLKRVIPILGRLFLGNPDNYRMLGQYTEAFGNCRTAATLFEAAGLDVTFRPLFFGCATALFGSRPGQLPTPGAGAARAGVSPTPTATAAGAHYSHSRRSRVRHLFHGDDVAERDQSGIVGNVSGVPP